jgi:hypothetical protein
MSKAKSKPSARTPDLINYGQTAWLWIGDPKVGVWLPDPLAALTGPHCTNGGVCPDPNRLGIKGDFMLQLLLLSCKPRDQIGGCDNYTCGYNWDGASFISDGTPRCQGNPCTCTDPNGVVSADFLQRIGIGTKCVTWCF